MGQDARPEIIIARALAVDRKVRSARRGRESDAREDARRDDVRAGPES